MKLALRVIVGLVLVASALSVFQTPAAACWDTPTSEHCYGIAGWYNHDNHGAHVIINMKCLYSPDGAGAGGITNELWVSKSGTNSNWTEAGFLYGGGSDSRYFFWADNRPGHPYFFHPRYDLPNFLNVDFDIYISHRATGSDIWDIRLNATYIGSSTDQFTSAANTLQTGSETTRYWARTESDSRDMEWQGAGGNFNADWKDGSSTAQLQYTGPNTQYIVYWQAGAKYSHVNYEDNKVNC